MRRPAFTLIEILVVVAIIGVIVAILLPTIRKVRDQAKEMKCRTHFQQLGRGFFTYAAAHQGFLCSGAFDPGTNAGLESSAGNNDGRDGPVSRIGWVADLVNSRSGYPNEMRCPTNVAQYNQKLAQLGGSRGPYMVEQADALIAKGYNTNYCQSWYMARGEVTNPRELNYRRVFGKAGPLNLSIMTRVAPSRVPLLGDASIESSDTYRGRPTARTMTDGPFEGPYSIQNYEDFGPAHGFAAIGETKGMAQSERHRANVLFGDGHVDVLIDHVRNGRFNVDDSTLLGTQEDLDQGIVFDGVLTLGRRSLDNWQKK